MKSQEMVESESEVGFVNFISTVAAKGKTSYSYVLSKPIFGRQPYFDLPRRNMNRRLDSHDQSEFNLMQLF